MKKFACLLFVVLLAAVFYGCGKSPVAVDTSSSSGGTTAAGTAKVSGTAVASNTDLTKMGLSSVSTSSMSLSKVNPLVTKGIIKPAALTSGTATLCTLNAAGEFVSTGVSTSLASDGSYTLNITLEAGGVLYYVKITKENAGKLIEMYAPVYFAGASSETTADSSATTTMLTITIEKIVSELSSAGLDAKTIDTIKTYMLETITALIASGDIKMPSLVRTSTDAENAELSKIVEALMTTGASKDIVDGLKMSLKKTKGLTDLASAKQFIKDVFTFITGGPENIPASVVDAMGQAYFDGKTASISEVVAAINSSGLDPATGAAKTLTVNPDDVVAAINTKLNGMRSALSAGTGTIPPIALAVFPPEELDSLLPVTSSTRFKVSQMMIIVQIVMDTMGAPFDPFKMMNNLGLYSMPSGLQIMHSEIRVVNYHNWGAGTGTDESDTPVLSSFVNVYDASGPGALAGAVVRLQYPMSDGTLSLESYNSELAGGGPPIGKMYKIAPWGDPSTIKMISNFQKSSSGVTCKIMAQVGSNIVTKEVTLIYIDLAGKKPALEVPKQTFDWSDISEIATDTPPVFSWVEPSGVVLPSGYDLRYAIDVTVDSGPGGGPPSWLYNSWDRQEFIKGNTFKLPSTAVLTADQRYFLGIRALAVESSTNRPVAEGPFVGAVFIAKAAGSMSSATTVYNLSGTITAPSGDTSLKVGVFKVNESIFVAGTEISPLALGAVAGDKTFTIAWTPGAMSGLKGSGIEVIAWNDNNGDGKITVPGPSVAGEPTSFSRKHIGYWGGMLSVYKESDGKDYPLADSLTGFDCDLTFGGMRAARYSKAAPSSAGLKKEISRSALGILSNPVMPDSR